MAIGPRTGRGRVMPAKAAEVGDGGGAVGAERRRRKAGSTMREGAAMAVAGFRLGG